MDMAGEALEVRLAGGTVRAHHLSEHFDVAAAAKTLARTRDDDAAHSGVAPHVGQRGQQRVGHLAVERVATGRPVEGEGGDPVLDLDIERLSH